MQAFGKLLRNQNDHARMGSRHIQHVTLELPGGGDTTPPEPRRPRTRLGEGLTHTGSGTHVLAPANVDYFAPCPVNTTRIVRNRTSMSSQTEKFFT